jgi:hypothetical protein
MDRREARRQLGWDDSERIVLFAATKPYEPRKRLDLAQAAVRCAEEDLGPIRLVIAENLPLESIPIMMNAADCLLLTSMAEGGPLVVKEAVLCTLPVVATDVGDVRQVLAGISPSAVCKHDAREIGTALVNVLKVARRSDGRDQRTALDQSTTIVQLLDLYHELGVRVVDRPNLMSSPIPLGSG